LVPELVVRQFPNGNFVQNSYLVGDPGARRAVLIDPGEDPAALLGEVKRGQWQVDGIWLTHAHLDHILGVAVARQLTGARVFLHPADRSLYDGVGRQAAEFGLSAPDLPAPDVELGDGDELVLGGHRFLVRHTPGHSPGSVSFIGAGRVFAGDVLFRGSIGRTDIVGGNFSTLMRSIHAHLLSLPDDTVLHSGHGEDSTIGIERRTNPFITGAVSTG
jgi:glyoxylase-like metal-dependent hydrolase (beta-lactamase superfamily II)